MNMEQRYWELREEVERAYDVYVGNPNRANEEKLAIAEDDFTNLCVNIVVQLMDENSDVLARLKG